MSMPDRGEVAPTACRPAYDVERIRADFPILSREIHGKPLVYLDNGASAQKPKAVLETIQRAYSEQEYANVHRGLHYLSNLATENYEKARESVRAVSSMRRESTMRSSLPATRPRPSIWSAQSFGGHDVIGEGDEIVLTDHGASLQYRSLALPSASATARCSNGRRFPTRASS